MAQSLGTRQKLLSRRRCETRKIEWRSPINPMGWLQTIYVSIGYDEDALTPRELFYDASYKSGSDMEALINDICILLSIVLQHDGVDLEQFAHSMSSETNERTQKTEIASLVGVLMKELRTAPEWALEIENAR